MEELLKELLSYLYMRRGIIFAILAALCYTGNSFLMKVSTQTNDSVQLVVVISLVIILCSLFFVVSKGISPPDEIEYYFWLLLSGISTSSYVIFFSFAVSFTEVGDALTVTYASLVIVGIMSWIMLKEAPRFLDIVFSILAFVGVAFIARPQFIFFTDERSAQKRGDDMLGIAFAFGSAVAISFSLTILRKQSHFGIHVYYPILSGGIVNLITSVALALLLHRGVYQSLVEWLLSIGAGLCYFFAQVIFVFCLRNGTSHSSECYPHHGYYSSIYTAICDFRRTSTVDIVCWSSLHFIGLYRHHAE
ncbi:Solute carrier family 35 member G1 [Holothuria leucospilota]|uniref:Solute carrier family 35 member G1 n=1 Tax=Holothuria leucospilota TaxID=206669 RepID=A0A9Q0YEC4_HOLLE|nr:Solute carrier family 35 member G1 [Holothuria leucospilota]